MRAFARASIVSLLLAASLHAQGNVLVIVADDVGVDMVGVYAEHPDPAHTPVLDQLAAEGMLFRNCWSNASCSPTRATILTGRYCFRTGLGSAIAPDLSAVELSSFEKSLPKAMPHAYQTIALGKWHLSVDSGNAMLLPSKLGFDHHRGAPWNLVDTSGQSAYFDWVKSIDGVLAPVNVYATTDTVNDAIDFISTTSGPWLMYLAFNAAHWPAHKPPAELHTYDLPPDISANKPIHTKAMIEAMDTELGRLFAAMGPELMDQTLILFVGDNGTDADATTAPFDPAHAKSTLYEGGVNVPLIVRGPGVAAGTECRGLVNTVDIYSTAVEFAQGIQWPGKDGVSMTPYFADPALDTLRPWVYAESFKPNGFGFHIIDAQTARGERYKLIRDRGPFGFYDGESLFDLVEDPWETTNLLSGDPLSPEAQTAYDELTSLLDSMQGPWKDLGQGLAGVTGVPKLTPDGPLLAGALVELTLESAAPSAPAALVLGLSAVSLPFHGGTMVPNPAGPGSQILLFATGGAGKVKLSSPWPGGIGAGFELFFQFWVSDAACFAGYSASNAVRALTQ